MKSKYMQEHIYNRQSTYEEAVCNVRDPFLNYCVWVSVSQCFFLCIFQNILSAMLWYLPQTIFKAP